MYRVCYVPEGLTEVDVINRINDASVEKRHTYSKSMDVYVLTSGNIVYLVKKEGDDFSKVQAEVRNTLKAEDTKAKGPYTDVTVYAFDKSTAIKMSDIPTMTKKTCSILSASLTGDKPFIYRDVTSFKHLKSEQLGDGHIYNLVVLNARDRDNNIIPIGNREKNRLVKEVQTKHTDSKVHFTDTITDTMTVVSKILKAGNLNTIQVVLGRAENKKLRIVPIVQFLGQYAEFLERQFLMLENIVKGK